MRAVFAFPPPSSPTYVPLGLASLAAWSSRAVPTAQLRTVDLNVAAWTRIAARLPGGPSLLDFVSGRLGSFFEPQSYGSATRVWNVVAAGIARLVREAREYLSTGTPPAGLASYLDEDVKTLLVEDPELIGFSCFSLDQIVLALALARRIGDQFPTGRRPRVVLGGAATSFVRGRDLLVACDFVDALAVGEGELATTALLENRKERETPGLVFRSAGGISHNQPPRTLSIRELPRPDFDALPLDRYWNPSPVLPALFSRGCRWRRCHFCAHNLGFAGYRRKSVEAFLSELEEQVVRYGARHFYIADQYIEATDLEAIATAIRNRALPIDWHVMGRPTEDYTPARLAAIRAGGCRWISWGVETGSQRLLDTIGKSTNARTIRRVIQNSHEAGISNLAMMIFGLPGSTDRDLEETFSFVEDLAPYLDAMTASVFTLWAETRFAREASRFGLSISEPEVLLDVAGFPARTFRLGFREVGEDGSLRDPRGTMEAALWEWKRRWIYPSTFLASLPSEHYLLYASGVARSGQWPPSPVPHAA